MKTSDILIQWYLKNKRDLPWRETRDPYKIWVSEVILQQTRVDQGLSYYHQFISQFPDITSLANATEDDVLRLWQGLGYYSRARNMLEAARMIVSENQGVFPDKLQDILKVKGIGHYTAAAVLSFAFGQAYPVIDGNVKRVISRYFGIKSDPALASAKKKLSVLLDSIFDHEQPDLFNQAIMEFGALQCRPVSPTCSSCPLQDKCMAHQKGITHLVPAKIIKERPARRYISCFVFLHESVSGIYVYIYKRLTNDIWAGLYDFPNMTADTVKERKEKHSAAISHLISDGFDFSSPVINLRHQLTHLSLDVEFYELRVNKSIHIEDAILKHFPGMNLLKISISNFPDYPFSALFRKYLGMTRWYNG